MVSTKSGWAALSARAKVVVVALIFLSFLAFAYMPEVLEGAAESRRLAYGVSLALVFGVIAVVDARRMLKKPGARRGLVWTSAALRWAGFSVIGFALANHARMDEVDGAPWAAAYSSGFLLLGAAHSAVSRTRPHLVDAVIGAFAFAVAFDHALSGEHDPEPVYLGIIGAAALVLLVIVAIPTIYRVWRATQDERERWIVTISTSIAFVLTIVGLSAFEVLERFDVAVRITTGWVLLVAAVSWFGSWFVIRERM